MNLLVHIAIIAAASALILAVFFAVKEIDRQEANRRHRAGGFR